MHVLINELEKQNKINDYNVERVKGGKPPLPCGKPDSREERVW